MQSLWKLVNKPRVDDWSPLAKFYYADEALNTIANELDSFDGRRDPDRCNQLVNKLRQAQDRVLHIIGEMLVVVFPDEADRACRDFRVKFPDEIVQDTLPGQLWFGAECLAAGSNIVDHEVESAAIRPMAKALTKHLDKMREVLRDQALRDTAHYNEKLKACLKTFDHLFADFEFSYVSAMVPVKSVKEHNAQMDVAVLFSECLARAISASYVTQDQIEAFDPTVIIALPRLAIVWGLLYYPQGALNVDAAKEELSEMFRHFHRLLVLIRDLLRELNAEELQRLEQLLVTGNSSTYDEQISSASVGMLSRRLVDEITSVPDTSIGKICADYQPVGTRHDASSSAAVGFDYIPVETTHPRTSSATHNDTSQRALYGSAENLIQRLFVCVAGVADQLQTNYSAEVRRVLKMVLQPMEAVPVYEVSGKTATMPENEEETGVEVRESVPVQPAFIGVRWVPDGECDECTACQSPFTMIRRRHHCRNCGRIFCSACSSNQLTIPELGYDKKVRVCNICFVYKINPFVTPQSLGVHSIPHAAVGSPPEDHDEGLSPPPPAAGVLGTDTSGSSPSVPSSSYS